MSNKKKNSRLESSKPPIKPPQPPKPPPNSTTSNKKKNNKLSSHPNKLLFSLTTSDIDLTSLYFNSIDPNYSFPIIDYVFKFRVLQNKG